MRFNSYKISVNFNVELNILQGTISFKWLNKSDYDISRIPINFLLTNQNKDYLVVYVNAVKCDIVFNHNGQNEIDGEIVLPFVLKPGDSIEIQFVFNSIADTGLFSNQIMFFENWYPSIYLLENNEFKKEQQYHSSFIVEIGFPSTFKMVTSGVVISREESAGITEVKVEAHDIPSFGIVLSENFIQESICTDFGVRIESSYFNDDKKYGHFFLDKAKEVINFYFKLFGFYPQPVISIIPGYDYPIGGRPVSANIVAIHRGIESMGDYSDIHAEWIIAHEIAHQYWGFNYLLEPLNYPRWFGISFGIYSDWLYSKNRSLDENLHSAFIKSYILGIRKGYDTTILQNLKDLNKHNFDWNSIITHGKAFAIIKMLSYELGESTFLMIMKYLLNNYKGKTITIGIFKEVCEKFTEDNLDLFFHQWYYTNLSLDFEICKPVLVKDVDRFLLEFMVHQKGEARINQLDIAFYNDRGFFSSLTISSKSFELRLSVVFSEAVNKIIIDPQRKLPIADRTYIIKSLNYCHDSLIG